jgi:hypothetical protein
MKQLSTEHAQQQPAPAAEQGLEDEIFTEIASWNIGLPLGAIKNLEKICARYASSPAQEKPPHGMIESEGYDRGETVHVAAQEKPVEAIPKWVAVKLLAARDAALHDDMSEVHHQLYGIADPTFTSLEPWKELESLATASAPPAATQETSDIER